MISLKVLSIFIAIIGIVTGTVCFFLIKLLKLDIAVVFTFWIMFQMFFIHYATTSTSLHKFLKKFDKTN